MKRWLTIMILLLAAALLSSCGIKFKTKKKSAQEYPDVVLGDFKYISADNSGRREFEIKASEAMMYNNRNEVFLYNMTMTFFNDNNQIKSFLSANSGYINKQTMNVFMEGKVKILSENQAVLEANKVYWDNYKKRFYSEPEELVTLRRGSSILTGYKLVADNELKEVTIESALGNYSNR